MPEILTRVDEGDSYEKFKQEREQTQATTTCIDFGGALQLMRAGIPVRRLAWEKKSPVKRKYKVEIINDEYGQRFKTTFLNYFSDHAVLMPEDLLAKDWIEVEL